MTGGGRPESKVPSFDRSVGRDSNLDQKGPGREPRSQLLKITSKSKPGVSFMAGLQLSQKALAAAIRADFGFRMLPSPQAIPHQSAIAENSRERKSSAVRPLEFNRAASRTNYLN